MASHRMTLVTVAVALATAACATARGQVEAASESTSARELLHRYWNLPSDSDAKYRGKRVVVAGLVERQEAPTHDGVALALQTDERGYFVRCWLSTRAAAGAGDLVRGQVVAVLGTVIGGRKDAPELKDCEVTWRGDPPGTRPSNHEQQALVTAESVMLCFARERMHALEGLHPAPSDPAFPHVKMERDRAARWESRSQAALARSGATALPCDHALVAIVSRCVRNRPLGLGRTSIVEGDRVFVGPERTLEELEAGSECASTQVKDALEKMTSDEEP